MNWVIDFVLDKLHAKPAEPKAKLAWSKRLSPVL